MLAPFALLRLGVVKLGLVAYKLLAHRCSSSVLIICRRLGTRSPRRSARMDGRQAVVDFGAGYSLYM
jgi:hypothetical protein